MIQIGPYIIDDKLIITSPGKFEGEPLFTPYFYDMIGEGSEDSYYDDPERGQVSIFELTKADHDQVPGIDPRTDYVLIWETEDGFVYHEQLTAYEYEETVKS